MAARRRCSLPALALAFLLLGDSAALAAAPPPSAQDLLRTAETSAAAAHKNVFVIFGASWCGWCHVLDDFMTKTGAAPVLDHNFVVVHLDVEESGAKAALDTPGGDALMQDFGGSDGLPFVVVLRPSGQVIANSDATGKPDSDIGYPVKPNEVAWFLHMLQAGAPALSPAALAQLQRQIAAYNQQHNLH